MKIAVRALGILLLLGALAAGAAQFQMWAVSGRFVLLRRSGKRGTNIDPPSLNLVQAVIERHIWPPYGIRCC
jgi:hypothetical protein